MIGDGRTESVVRVDNLSRKFASDTAEACILQSVTFAVAPGEIVVLVGPNGVGKSTLLRAAIGLDLPDEGVVSRRVAPQRIGVVMQDYGRTVLPWLTAMENLCLPLLPLVRERSQRYRIAVDHLESIGVVLPFDSYPRQLSGGQRQILCVARALITKPELLAMDEPFASLDQDRKRTMRRVLVDYVRRSRAAAIIVSHDVDEVLLLADRILVLSGRPAKLHEVAAIQSPGHRTPDMLLSPEALKIRQAIWTDLL